MDFIRVEVSIITNKSLPPVIFPKVSGHRRVYAVQDQGTKFMINVMAIGDRCDGVTFGEVDGLISETSPESYLSPITPDFVRIARERGVMSMPVAFVGVINPLGPQIVEIFAAPALVEHLL